MNEVRVESTPCRLRAFAGRRRRRHRRVGCIFFGIITPRASIG